VDSGKAFLSGITQTIESRFPHLQDLEIIFPDDVVADKELREFAQAYGTIYLANQKLKEGNPKQSNAPNGKTTDSPIAVFDENNFIDHLTYNDKLRLNNLKDNLYVQELYEIIPVEKQVIKYIKARAPPKSVYDKLVFFLERGQIKFYTLELDDALNFPRAESIKNNIRYFNSYSEKTHYIHVTKAYYDNYLKGNTELTARLVLHFWVERFLSPSYNESRHQHANRKEQALVDPSKTGLYLDKARQQHLDRLVKEENQEDLLGLITEYDIRMDPDRVYQQALYEAVRKLEKKLGHFTIERGEDLIAWHRYMIESDLRKELNWELTDIVLNISNIIREGVEAGWIKKTLLYRDNDVEVYDRNLAKYNHRYLFPYSHQNYHSGQVVFIPQCPIKLDEAEFSEVSINVEPQRAQLGEFAAGMQIKAVDQGIAPDKAKKTIGGLDKTVVIKMVLEEINKIRRERRFNNDNRAVVVGILAPGGAGKTTFAEALDLASKAIDLKSGYVGADGYLHPGSGFRYDTDEEGYRNTHIWGPGIYNDIELWRILNHLKEGRSLIKSADKHARKAAEEIGPELDVLITDGVYLGLDKQLGDTIDILVSLYVDRTEATRLAIKTERDMAKGSTHKGTEIILDFSEKQHHETKDGLKTLMLEKAEFVWLRHQLTVYVRRGASSAIIPVIRLDRNVGYGAITKTIEGRFNKLVASGDKDIVDYSFTDMPQKTVTLESGAEVGIVLFNLREEYEAMQIKAMPEKTKPNGTYASVDEAHKNRVLNETIPCYFCHLYKKQIIAEVIIDNRAYYLIPNKFPYVPFHMLIVSKDKLNQSLNSVRIHDAFIILRAMGQEYETTFNSPRAGYSVPHLHFHMFRKYTNLSKFIERREKVEAGRIEGWVNKAFMFEDNDIDIPSRYLAEAIGYRLKSDKAYNTIFKVNKDNFRGVLIARNKEYAQILPGHYSKFAGLEMAGHILVKDKNIYQQLISMNLSDEDIKKIYSLAVESSSPITLPLDLSNVALTNNSIYGWPNQPETNRAEKETTKTLISLPHAIDNLFDGKHQFVLHYAYALAYLRTLDTTSRDEAL
ncbi:MAG TPA: HIT domain-containing protein, partial [Candidatus Omnitrophica bacterium]|nr:HIT domain-containing protein [Candidatus Omnitrophota bacterium]